MHSFKEARGIDMAYRLRQAEVDLGSLRSTIESLKEGLGESKSREEVAEEVWMALVTDGLLDERVQA